MKKWLSDLSVQAVGSVIGAGLLGVVVLGASFLSERWWVVAVVVLAIAILASLAIRPLRTKAWGWVPLRVTTVRRIAALVAVETDKAKGIEAARVKAADELLREQIARTAAEADLDNTKDQLAHAANSAKAYPALLASLSEDLSKARAHAEDNEQQLSKARDEAAASEKALVALKKDVADAKKQAALPKPGPRWHISRHRVSDGALGRAGGSQFHIANGVPGSVALGVRVDDGSETSVVGNGYWADLSDESQALFDAIISESGQDYGYSFIVSWYDENGVKASALLESGPTRSRYGMF